MLKKSLIENKIHFQPNNAFIDTEHGLHFENNQTFLRLNHIKKEKNNDLALNDKDLEILKNSMLFKNWNDLTFKNFINDERVKLKRFKYKEVIANEKQCKENLFLVKIGQVLVWIKIDRQSIKNYQSVTEKFIKKNSIALDFDVEKTKSRFLRDKLLDARSGQDMIESRYLQIKKHPKEQFQAARNQQISLSRLSRTTTASIHSNRKYPLNTLKIASNDHEMNLAKPPLYPHAKYPPITSIFPSNKEMLNLKAASARVTNKRPLFDFRASSSNLIRINGISHYLMNNKKQPNNNQEQVIRLETMSSKIETEKLARAFGTIDLWSEGLDSNQESSSCFLKLIMLKPNEFFGLSEYLFDEKREHEKILDSIPSITRSATRTSTYVLKDDDEEDDDGEIRNTDLIDPNKPNNYHLIAKSTYAECYMIDKENYFKYMLTFSSDKTQINQYMDEMRIHCYKLPSSKEINKEFLKHLNWKIYKKHIYNQEILSKQAQSRITPTNLHFHNQNNSRKKLVPPATTTTTTNTRSHSARTRYSRHTT